MADASRVQRGKMQRFREWDREAWTWRRFRGLPVDFQIFAAIGALAAITAIALVVAIPILGQAS